MKRLLTLFFILSFLLTACQEKPYDVCQIDATPNIYPDYLEVTIPQGIAPLNFCLMEMDGVLKPASSESLYVVIRDEEGDSIVSSGKQATDFDLTSWHRLLDRNKGKRLTLTTYAKRNGRWMQYRDFCIFVSEYPLEEYGLTYRKFAPGYVLSTDMGIFQRDLHTFAEESTVRNTELNGHCIGCHTSCRTDEQYFSLHVRGKTPATILRTKDQEFWLKTEHDSTLSKCVYPSWHPKGKHIAYSLNQTHQMFWTTGQHNIEVFDVTSDLVVVDIDQKQLLRTPLLERTDNWFETYPAFSGNGETLYFCRTPYLEIPTEVDSLHYSLCSISFNAETGSFGDSIHTLIDGDAESKSITFPRPSYDGKWLVYTQADNGCFSIHHQESDLWIMDLERGERRQMDVINSKRAESFANWNGNSHWLVFCSRRDDGQYTRLYLTCIDNEGQASKPVLLPQRDPWHYYHESLFSYNTPDFISSPVVFDVHDAYKQVTNGERTPLGIR